MDRNQIFAKVKRHLLKQNAKAGYKGAYRYDNCFYRYGGKSCAIGCLISDEAYSPHLETHPVDAQPVQTALWLSGIDTKGNKRFLRALQRVHDQVEVEDWRKALNQVAKEFKIKELR